MRHISSQESGRSMIEMLGVLAIIGVLSVGGIAGYSMAMAKFKTTKAVDQIQTITTNVRTLLAGQRRWPSVTTAAQWYNLGVLTDDSWDGKTGINTYGGELAISTDGDQNKRTFTVTIKAIPQDACVKIGASDWGGDPGSGLVSIKIGTQEALTWAAGTLPPSLTDVSAGCADKNSNQIIWTYK